MFVLPLAVFFAHSQPVLSVFPLCEFSLFCEAFFLFFQPFFFAFPLALFRLPLSNIQHSLMHPLSLASFSEWNGLASSAKAKAS